jgi:diadenosine tetraphosphate (Ap4A) HIT family hydrolase
LNTLKEQIISRECPHCQRVREAISGQLGRLLYQTDNVIVIAGDHQFFPGYCVVIAKVHTREIHDLPVVEAGAIFQEVLNVGRIIQASFGCLKMNYASLGNIDEHLHWHVIPRYASDPDHKDHPWKNSAIFADYPITPQAVAKLRSLFPTS